MELFILIGFIDVWITSYKHLKRIEALERKVDDILAHISGCEVSRKQAMEEME